MWYTFIHPIWQLIALYLGIKNLSIGFNKSQSWTFPMRTHRKIGFIFVIMTAIGAVIGRQVNLLLAHRGKFIHISGHRLLANSIIVLLILIVISGLIKQRHTFRLRWLQFLHPWFGFLAMGLMFAQLFLTLSKLIGW